MKFLNAKTFLIVLMALSLNAISQEMVVDSKALDVDGYVAEPQVTDPELEQVKGELRRQKQTIQVNKEKSKTYEKLARATDKLVDSTVDLIEERKESKKKIADYNKKIECLMDEDRDPRECRNADSVSTTQAAVTSNKAVNTDDSDLFTDDLKVMPYFAANMITTERENIETEYDFGLQVESNITERFSMGAGLGYRTFRTVDFGGAQFLGGGINPWYQNTFGLQGREIEYANLNVDLFGKFYITKKNRFRPYVGAGLSYNRSTLNYAGGNQMQNFNQFNFGQEDLTLSYASMNIMLGSEIKFTKTMGLNVMGQYSTGLGDALSQNGGQNNLFFNPDQRRLEQLAAEIQQADIFTFMMGMIVSF
jgi:uncharacterized protein YdbL (DUF1318 family)